jgi:glycosyltransferase involved in cell wall biosynthesis
MPRISTSCIFIIDLLQFPLVRALGLPAVTTLHGRQDLPDLPVFSRAFTDMPLVSISDHQRAPLPGVNWVRTIYHGLPRDLLAFRPEPDPEGYLVFLGRISPEKRPDRAIEIAVRAGMPLKIAAKVSDVDATYWNEEIAPLVRRYPSVEFLGELGEDAKARLLGRATALLFPIDWPEPFGLVMIEAMACGTPVIAFPHGSVVEVVDHGRTGFLAANVVDAVDAIHRLPELDRTQVRATFERRFDIARVAAEYVEVYQSLRANTSQAQVLPLSA